MHGKSAANADDLISALILLPSLYCSSCHQTGRNRHTCEGGSGKDARAGNAAHAEPASQQAFPRPAGSCSPWPVTWPPPQSHLLAAALQRGCGLCWSDESGPGGRVAQPASSRAFSICSSIFSAAIEYFSASLSFDCRTPRPARRASPVPRLTDGVVHVARDGTGGEGWLVLV